MREMIAAQMDGTYFPITLRELGARVFFRNLSEQDITFGDVTVRTLLLSHPGNCLGYRITTRGRSFCYVTDNELYLKDTPGFQQNYVDKLLEFAQGSDVLLTDTTYTDAEYPKRIHWGHSCVSQVVAFAHAAGVKHLQIMHHDPGQTDDDIDRKLEDARNGLAKLGSSVDCTAPAEGSRLRLGAGGKLTARESLTV
jgi:phosphoribosyl 1,2-cyclic phosphodiesterase